MLIFREKSKSIKIVELEVKVEEKLMKRPCKISFILLQLKTLPTI